MKSEWTESEREKVAEELLREYSHVSFEKLLEAIRACDIQVSRADGWDALIRCVKDYLKKDGVTPTGGGDRQC